MKVLDHLNYVSPNPCAHITVAVCFFSAGTTRGAAVAMLLLLLLFYLKVLYEKEQLPLIRSKDWCGHWWEDLVVWTLEYEYE